MSETLAANLVVILALTAPGWAMFLLFLCYLVGQGINFLKGVIDPPGLEHPRRFKDFVEMDEDLADLRRNPHYIEITNSESPAPMFVRRVPDHKYDKLEP